MFAFICFDVNRVQMIVFCRQRYTNIIEYVLLRMLISVKEVRFYYMNYISKVKIVH